MLLKIDQIDHLLLVAMATRLYFLCTAAMFVWTVEPEKRSHTNETSYGDTHTASLEGGKREGERKREEGWTERRKREGGDEDGERREKGRMKLEDEEEGGTKN